MPPPGYFCGFSEKVLARLQSEIEEESCSWWQRLLDGLDVKPVLACAYGLAVGGLLTFGVSLAQVVGEDHPAGVNSAGPPLALTAIFPVAVDHRLASDEYSTRAFLASPSSVHPVISSASPGFALGDAGLRVQPVSFAR